MIETLLDFIMGACVVTMFSVASWLVGERVGRDELDRADRFLVGSFIVSAAILLVILALVIGDRFP